MYFEYKCFKNGFKRYIYVDIYLVCGHGFCKHILRFLRRLHALWHRLSWTRLSPWSWVMSVAARQMPHIDRTIDGRQSEKQLQREDAELRVTPAAANDIQSYFLADTALTCLTFTPAPPVVPHNFSLCLTFLEESKPAEWKRRKYCQQEIIFDDEKQTRLCAGRTS